MKINASEIKEYLGLREEVNKKIDKIIYDNGLEGCDFNSLEIVENYNVCSKNGKKYLVNKEGCKIADETDNYFVDQYTGYFGDDYYGYVYLPTDEKGTYIKIYYEC